MARTGPAHDARGDVQYRPARAVVLLETKHPRAGESALELQDVLHPGAPPAVDSLIVIPHGEHAPMAAREQGYEFILRGVGVLVFIDENFLKTVLIFLENVGMSPEHA